MKQTHAWMGLAESAITAAAAVRSEHPRSSVSRAYYSAFAACHALLAHLRPEMAWPGRANFKHGELPGELRWTLQHKFRRGLSVFQADVYRDCLEETYNLRRQADYKPDRVITADHAEDAVERAGQIVRLARGVIQ